MDVAVGYSSTGPKTNLVMGITIGQIALCWFMAEAWMSSSWSGQKYNKLGWGRSQPKDILAEAINQHKANCRILMTIIARQNISSVLILFKNL